MADEIVVNAFLTVFAYLYGNYKEFLTPDFQTDGQKFQVRERKEWHGYAIKNYKGMGQVLNGHR